MLTFRWNAPELARADYARLLNASFGGGWDERAARWYLERPFDGRRPQKLVLFDGVEPVSGACLNYRTLEGPDRLKHSVAIVTGAWTAPQARGRGHYKSVLQELARHAAEDDCGMLLGFVTADNPSHQGMQSAGAHLVRSWYCTAKAHEPESDSADNLPEIHAMDAPFSETYARASVPSGRTGIRYSTERLWRDQFVERVNPVEALAIGGESVALIESVGQTDRLQWLSGPDRARAPAVAALRRRAVRNGRDFFLFGAGEWVKRAADEAGLSAQAGAITCLPTAICTQSLSEAVRASWELQSGDRM